MGKGGNSQGTPEMSMRKAARGAASRTPSAKPPFTVGDIKRAVPPHCFERSLARSCAYLAGDLTIMAFLFFCTTFFSHPAIPKVVTYGLLWPTYWALQGCVATGVWVIAHECGHQAFCELGWLNDTVGLVLHSCLLVPYFSWKYSHRRHHSNTGSMERDEVFVPKKPDGMSFYSEYMQLPLGRLVIIITTLTLGWPMYLMLNSTGRKYEKQANHFHPSSPIFSTRERFFVGLSDAGLIVVLAIIYCAGLQYGFGTVFQVYGAPLLVVNAFLVLITFLQHTHSDLPHYESSEWDWLRGALATVDRDYGVLNHVFHHISDTHVAHHLFSTMPHYHAQEATEAIKPVLGEYYKFDSTPVPAALWREFTECRFVAPDEGANPGVVWYRSMEYKQQ